MNDLDPSAVVRSSEVPDLNDKWEDVDLSSLCIFNELPLEPCDNEVMFSRSICFDSSSTDAIDYAKDFLRRQSTLENLLSAKSPDDCDDANSIWSILTDKLLYCQSDTSDSVRHFSYDSLKAKSAKQRFFNAALSNEPSLSTSYIDSCNMAELYRDQLYDTVPKPNKKKLNTAEATANSNEPIEKRVFPQYVEDRYQDLEINTSYKYNPETSICATYLWTENVGYPKDLVTATAYHTEGYKLWFKQGRFPIGIDGEATAHLLDDTPISVKTLIDSGASRPILSKHFYDKHQFLHTYPRYKIPPHQTLKVRLPLKLLKRGHQTTASSSKDGVTPSKVWKEPEVEEAEVGTLTGPSEAALQKAWYDLFQKDLLEVQKVRAQILELREGEVITQQVLDSSPAFRLRRAVNDSPTRCHR